MERAYPVLRIDDYEEAKRYYLDYLGFTVEFEWRHEENFPVYMGIARGDLGLHLTEHRGDADGPGAAYLLVESVHVLYEALKSARPGMTEEPIDQAWGSTELKLVDPFGNKLTFTSPTPES